LRWATASVAESCDDHSVVFWVISGVLEGCGQFADPVKR
jgi:hypothetical protein